MEDGKCELDFNLNDMVPEHHLYGSFNKNLEFVSFTQSPSESVQLGSLDFFCVSFLTKNSHIYTLTPLLLQNMVMREEHFSSTLLSISDMLAELEQESGSGWDSRCLRMFKNELMEGKQMLGYKPGICSVTIKKQNQKLLAPIL